MSFKHELSLSFSKSPFLFFDIVIWLIFNDFKIDYFKGNDNLLFYMDAIKDSAKTTLTQFLKNNVVANLITS